MSSILDLPTEMICEIMGFLPMRSVTALGSTSRFMNVCQIEFQTRWIKYRNSHDYIKHIKGYECTFAAYDILEKYCNPYTKKISWKCVQKLDDATKNRLALLQYHLNDLKRREQYLESKFEKCKKERRRFHNRIKSILDKNRDKLVEEALKLKPVTLKRDSAMEPWRGPTYFDPINAYNSLCSDTQRFKRLLEDGLIKLPS